MNIEEVKRDVLEMSEQLESLVNSGQIRNEFLGFVYGLVQENFTGFNLSKGVLELPLEKRLEIVSMFLTKLEISPDDYLNHIQKTTSGLLGLIKRGRRRF